MNSEGVLVTGEKNKEGRKMGAPKSTTAAPSKSELHVHTAGLGLETGG